MGVRKFPRQKYFFLLLIQYFLLTSFNLMFLWHHKSHKLCHSGIWEFRWRMKFWPRSPLKRVELFHFLCKDNFGLYWRWPAQLWPNFTYIASFWSSFWLLVTFLFRFVDICRRHSKRHESQFHKPKYWTTNRGLQKSVSIKNV